MYQSLIENAATAFAALLRPGVLPKKKKKPLAKEALITEAELIAKYHEAQAGELKPNAAFKRKYGILSKVGKAKPEADRVDSDYGFPMPSKTHVKAVRYAHAVLSRAHQAKAYDQADVDKQVRKANVVLYGTANPTRQQKSDHAKKTSQKKESDATRRVPGKLAEYMPIASKGSWERNSAIVAKAARDEPQFGGGPGGCSWDIGLYASYPEKSVVIVSNCNTGQIFAAKYEIADDGTVTFPTVKAADLTISVQEAVKALKPARVSESGNDKPATTNAKESLHFMARVREIKEVAAKGPCAVCVMLEEGPGNPVDGHYYTDECIDATAASGVFEGSQAFGDHPTELEERNQPERSIYKLIGWWSDVHVEENDGKKQLIGTFNIETGNEFALNKMREAKRYQEKYPDNPAMQYVGFSIYAGGVSELREIDGQEYKAVTQITQAGSTDMVTRAGARGRMVSLQEAMTLATTSERRAAPNKKQLDAIASNLMEALTKKLNASKLNESTIDKVVDAWVKESKMEVDDKHIHGLKKALAKHVGGEIMGGKGGDAGASDEEDEATHSPMIDEEEEDDMGMGEGVTGDSDIDDMLGDEDPDGDGDDDLDPDDDTDHDFAGKKKKEALRVAAQNAEGNGGTRTRETATVSAEAKELARVKAQLAESETQNKKFRAQASLMERSATARRIVKEMNVKTKESRDYLVAELIDGGGNEQKMRERATRLYNAIIKPLSSDGVSGPGAITHSRESIPASGTITFSGIVRESDDD